LIDKYGVGEKMEEVVQENSRGLGPREEQVISKLHNEPDQCVRLYRNDGKIVVFASEAWAYQAWGWRVIKRLIRRGLVLITIKTSPQTGQPVKYLCLSK